MSGYKRIWISVLILAVFIAISCQSPPSVLPSPPSLLGEYTGTYTRQVEDTDSNLVEPIHWSFSEGSFSIGFSCFPCPGRIDSVPLSFADCAGYYSLGAGIVLSAPGSSSLDSNLSPRTCGGPYSVYGRYVLDQPRPGEMIMTSLIHNPQGMSVTRTIHLFKKS